jgi:hypothetical protein
MCLIQLQPVVIVTAKYGTAKTWLRIYHVFPHLKKKSALVLVCLKISIIYFNLLNLIGRWIILQSPITHTLPFDAQGKNDFHS